MKPRIFNSRILEAKNPNPNVKYLKFSLPKFFKFKAGQYLSMSYFAEEKKFRNPYSIATIPGKRSGEFYIKLNNKGMSFDFVQGLKKGDEVELFGPLGKFVLHKDSRNKDLIFITTGTGLTPYVGLVEELLKKGFKKKIIFLKGFRNEKEILFDKEFKTLQKKYKNFEFHNILSLPINKKFRDEGYVQDFLGKYVPEDFKGDFYLCGRKEMIKDATKKLERRRVNKSRVFS